MLSKLPATLLLTRLCPRTHAVAVMMASLPLSRRRNTKTRKRRRKEERKEGRKEGRKNGRKEGRT